MQSPSILSPRDREEDKPSAIRLGEADVAGVFLRLLGAVAGAEEEAGSGGDEVEADLGEEGGGGLALGDGEGGGKRALQGRSVEGLDVYLGRIDHLDDVQVGDGVHG